ncbi:MAG: diacylglycerol kinase, partial [Devosia sp.]|nr:diacylglycerol kinase [Devosia sp.]
IGSDGAIPWRLPSDFAHFKRTTMGKPLIMGRKTFESIGKPLPGRTNIVVTRQRGYQPDGVLVFDSLAAALDHAQAIAAADRADEVMIGGGGEIYREAMPVAERLYVTHVAASPKGSVRFPPIDPKQWQVEAELEVLRTERDSADFAVKVYRRRGPEAR